MRSREEQLDDQNFYLTQTVRTLKHAAWLQFVISLVGWAFFVYAVANPLCK